jgi:prevent-host-death family protein
MNKDKKNNEEYIFEEAGNVSVAEAKSNFSEYIARAAFANEKIIITKRGRPIAAIVSIDDVKKMKQDRENNGLENAAGKWKDFEDISEDIEEVYKKRKMQKGRDVSF